MKTVKRALRDDRGSASIEFVALAIPLFIPLFIFINHFAAMSDTHDSLRTLAREAARGFVTSSSDAIAFEVAQQIVSEGGRALGYQDALDAGEIQMDIYCSLRPCISPDSEITISLTRLSAHGGTIKVAAIAYVSPWA